MATIKLRENIAYVLLVSITMHTCVIFALPEILPSTRVYYIGSDCLISLNTLTR